MWTNEMRAVYEIAKKKRQSEKVSGEVLVSNWKKYEEKEYIEEFLYDAPQKFKERLLSELGDEGKEYVVPLVVAIMKNRPVGGDAAKSMVEDEIESAVRDKIPDYIYNF